MYYVLRTINNLVLNLDTCKYAPGNKFSNRILHVHVAKFSTGAQISARYPTSRSTTLVELGKRGYD